MEELVPTSKSALIFKLLLNRVDLPDPNELMNDPWLITKSDSIIDIRQNIKEQNLKDQIRLLYETLVYSNEQNCKT